MRLSVLVDHRCVRADCQVCIDMSYADFRTQHVYMCARRLPGRPPDPQPAEAGGVEVQQPAPARLGDLYFFYV